LDETFEMMMFALKGHPKGGRGLRRGPRDRPRRPALRCGGSRAAGSRARLDSDRPCQEV